MDAAEQLAEATRYLGSGLWSRAEQSALLAMRHDPKASLIAGMAVAATGDATRAAPILLQAAGAWPTGDHPCLDLLRLTPSLPTDLIEAQFRACLTLAPKDDRLRLAFAEFLLDTDRAEPAGALLAEGPDTVARHHLLGLAYADQGRFPESIAAFRRAVALDPTAAPCWSNLGMILKVEGHAEPAIEAHDRAVALAPENPRFRVNRAVALLKSGAWSRAWRDYEARLELPGVPAMDRNRLLPSLDSGVSLAGRTVVALHEDGFGDTLQFLRYLPLLAERGARVIAVVPTALERLMRLVPGIAEVLTDAGRLPAHEYVCPMFSLPRVFGTTVATIPPVPPVTLDAGLLRQWRERLPSGGVKVGLVWAGQARPTLPGFGTLDRRRSAGLAAFAPLAHVLGACFVSLQAGTAANQAPPPGLTIIDQMSGVRDFADTAAIIAGLDVVISVDTSVVHLAGLMGKPVFLLDRYDGCWRWLSGRSDSPWYPNLTIFRQQRPNDWSESMNRTKDALLAMIRERQPVPDRLESFPDS